MSVPACALLASVMFGMLHGIQFPPPMPAIGGWGIDIDTVGTLCPDHSGFVSCYIFLNCYKSVGAGDVT